MATCLECGNEYNDDFMKVKAAINRGLHERLIEDEDDLIHYEVEGMCPRCAVQHINWLGEVGREAEDPFGFGIDDD